MSIKIIDKNKKAGYEFFLHEKYEAGMVLTGTEVKSLRNNKASIQESYVMIDQHQEAWIYNLTIPHYEFGNITNHLETRKRKLLLKKSEITQIQKLQKQHNYTIIPTILYFKESLVKIEIALAKGKKLHDKRESKKEADVKKNIRRGVYED